MTANSPENFVVLRQQEPADRAAQTEKITAGMTERPAATVRVAVIVCHGMGQQIPFETIDTVARVLRRASPVPSGTVVEYPQVTTRIVDLGIGKPVARAELQVADPVGREREVHVYETY